MSGASQKDKVEQELAQLSAPDRERLIDSLIQRAHFEMQQKEHAITQEKDWPALFRK